jgi:GDP-4-dehydro-6-deoxy-D-mannose reductase
MKKVLITGIGGSGGSYFAEHLLETRPGADIHGVVRWHTATSNRNLEKILGKVNLHECDLTDFSSVLSVLKKAEPDSIVHLASYANVRTSFDNPLAVVRDNVAGTHNLFEAVRNLEITPKIHLCSTSEVYGKVRKEDVPIIEDCPLRPVSPYAVSKTAQDLLGFMYFQAFKVPIVRTRMFTYLNPRREDIFATAFAKQVAKIELGLQEELVHGNLDSTRTIIDIRDAMEAYCVATEQGRPGEVYNIGGDKVITIGEFLEVLKGFSTKKIVSRQDPSLLRPVDVTLQIPDSSKFRNETGWRPKYSFEDSVKLVLDFWRKEVAKEYGILHR